MLRDFRNIFVSSYYIDLEIVADFAHSLEQSFIDMPIVFHSLCSGYATEQGSELMSVMCWVVFTYRIIKYFIMKDPRENATSFPLLSFHCAQWSEINAFHVICLKPVPLSWIVSLDTVTDS